MMQICVLIFLLVTCFANISVAYSLKAGQQLFGNSSQVTDLNTADDVRTLLDSLTSPNGSNTVLSLVLLYVGWCPHCHHYAPQYEVLAKHLKCHENIKFYAFECSGSELNRLDKRMLTPRVMCNEWGIKTYPTVFTAYKAENGTVLHPKIALAQRDTPKMISWIQQNTTQLNAADCYPGMDATPLDSSRLRVNATHLIRWDEQATRMSPDRRFFDAIRGLENLYLNWLFLKSTKLQQEPLAALRRFTNSAQFALPGGNIRESMGKIGIFLASKDIFTEPEVVEFVRGLDFGLPPFPQYGEAAYEVCQSTTCSTWTLFHIISLYPLSVVEHGESVPASGYEIMESMKGLIENFFACSFCSEHFVHYYGLCAASRCSWVQNVVGKYSPAEIPSDGQGEVGDNYSGLALWLWRFHNSVTVRTAIEKSEDRVLVVSPVTFVGQDVRFPTEGMCSTCFGQNGRDRFVLSEGLAERYNKNVTEIEYDRTEDANLHDVKEFLLRYYVNTNWTTTSDLRWEDSSSSFLVAPHAKPEAPQVEPQVPIVQPTVTPTPTPLALAWAGGVLVGAVVVLATTGRCCASGGPRLFARFSRTRNLRKNSNFDGMVDDASLRV